MLGLMLVLLTTAATEPAPQAVQATLQSCVVENGRYVCRYAVPDIVIVPIPGDNIVADAPAVILGRDATPETPTPETRSPEAPTLALPPIVTEPAPPATAAVDPGPARPIDAGVLTERESALVARCADAGWMSLCLPDDRRAARSLRDRETAYLAVRREVTRLLAEDECEDAVKTALEGGYLALARETRDYCAAPKDEADVEAAETATPPDTEAAKPEETADAVED